MNARRFGVSTIWAMFSRVRSKTSGSSCSSRKTSTSSAKVRCSGENSKSMWPVPVPILAVTMDLTGRQIRPHVTGSPFEEHPEGGERGAAGRAGGGPGGGRGELRAAIPYPVHRHPRPGRLSASDPGSGDDVGVPQLGQGGVVEAELGPQHLGGVLADPRHPALGALGHRTASPGCRARARRSRPRRCGASRRACGAPRCADRRSRRARSCSGPPAMPDRGELPRRVELRAVGRPRLDRGADHRLEVRPSRRAWRSAGRPSTRDGRRGRRASRTGARARPASRRSRRRRRKPSQITSSSLPGSGRTPSDQKLVTTSVIATHGVEHGDVDVLAEPGAVAVAQRGEDADDARTTPS